MTTKSAFSKLDIIRGLAVQLSRARAKLAKSVAALTAKVDAAHRRHVPIIRQQVGAVADAESLLRAALKNAPELFIEPRTITEAGIKCGYQGHDESLDMPKKKAEREAVVAQVKKLFTAEQITTLGLLIPAEEPNAAALLEHCTEKQIESLVRAGASHTPAGDHLLVRPADAAIDKLVAKLLKAASDAAKDGEEAAS